MITFKCPFCRLWKTEKERMPYPIELCKTCCDDFVIGLVEVNV